MKIKLLSLSVPSNPSTPPASSEQTSISSFSSNRSVYLTYIRTIAFSCPTTTSSAFDCQPQHADHPACPSGLPGESAPTSAASDAQELTRPRQFLMTLFILALTGNVIADAFAGNHSIINYTMFVAVFAMLSLLYLIGAAIMESFAIPLAMIALDAINMLLFLIGGIALAAYLGVHSCGNQVCSKRQPARNSSDSAAGLSPDQQDHQRLPQHVQKVPRRTGCMRLPLVRLCRMGSFSRPFVPGVAWRRIQRAPKRQAKNPAPLLRMQPWKGMNAVSQAPRYAINYAQAEWRARPMTTQANIPQKHSC
ncbi:MAG: hypothetical protein L6R40_002024 [Gallowayella cf. fulva]|nr:MAG: hypothetical protein L6R40_002024 [Xanthomendoza cf. fulva]